MEGAERGGRRWREGGEGGGDRLQVKEMEQRDKLQITVLEIWIYVHKYLQRREYCTFVLVCLPISGGLSSLPETTLISSWV
jgi:hypothetical protein